MTSINELLLNPIFKAVMTIEKKRMQEVSYMSRHTIRGLPWRRLQPVNPMKLQLQARVQPVLQRPQSGWLQYLRCVQ